MRHKIIFSLALLTLTFLNACKRGGQQDVLSRAKMTEILIDQHVLESKVLLLKVRTDSMTKIYNSLEKEIFEKHGVEKEQFEKSYLLYLKDPVKMEAIYNVVVDSLNVLDQQAAVYEEEQEKEKKRKKREEKVQQMKKDSALLANKRDSIILANGGDSSLLMTEQDSAILAAEEDSVKVVRRKPGSRIDSLRRLELKRVKDKPKN